MGTPPYKRPHGGKELLHFCLTGILASGEVQSAVSSNLLLLLCRFDRPGQKHATQSNISWFLTFLKIWMEVAEALKLGRDFLTPSPSMFSFSPLVYPPSLPPPPALDHIPCCCQLRIWMKFILIVSLCKHCVAVLMQPEESYWFSEREGYLDGYPVVVVTFSSPLRIIVNFFLFGGGGGGRDAANDFFLPCKLW